MLAFLTNMPIFRRLFLAFTLATALPAISIALLGVTYLNSLDVRGQAERSCFDAQNVAAQQLISLQRMNALLQTRHTQIFASLGGNVHDPSLNASGALINSDILAREGDFEQALQQYQGDYEIATASNMSTVRGILMSDDPTSGIISDQQNALNAVINTQWPAYKQLQDQELGQLQKLQGDLQSQKSLSPLQLNEAYAQAYLTLFNANSAFTNLRNSWQQVEDSAVSMGKTVTAVGPSETQPILLFTASAIVFAIIVILSAASIVNLTITRPLRQLVLLTRHITRGDTGARATPQGSDEIFVVASSMNRMLDRIVQLIQDAQAQRDALQVQVENLVSEVSGIAEGDLRIQAEVTTDALGVLADSFNYMVGELSSLIVRVKLLSQEVGRSTTGTFERMAQLVGSADFQIKQMATAANEVGHMANSSRQVAERAQVLTGIALQARQTAQTGRDTVQQTLRGMEHIHENVQVTAGKVQLLADRSREIDNIIDVMVTIAQQTNRLALDAAIQAAMAGENGKGFGAVAVDIRHLAERAKVQAGMIAHIVRGVREDIGSVAVSMVDTERETSMGTGLAQEIGTSLESIFAVIEHQAQEIEIINQMTKQQLQSSSAVVNIMKAVTDSTQQSNTITREVSQNMERLARLAKQLLASVGAFKLQDSQRYVTPAANAKLLQAEAPDNRGMVNGSLRTVSNPGIRR